MTCANVKTHSEQRRDHTPSSQWNVALELDLGEPEVPEMKLEVGMPLRRILLEGFAAYRRGVQSWTKR